MTLTQAIKKNLKKVDSIVFMYLGNIQPLRNAIFDFLSPSPPLRFETVYDDQFRTPSYLYITNLRYHLHPPRSLPINSDIGSQHRLEDFCLYWWHSSIVPLLWRGSRAVSILWFHRTKNNVKIKNRTKVIVV